MRTPEERRAEQEGREAYVASFLSRRSEHNPYIGQGTGRSTGGLMKLARAWQRGWSKAQAAHLAGRNRASTG